MKLRIVSAKTTILILGIYQIMGALTGFYIIAMLLLRTNEISGATLLFIFIAIGLYSLSVKAGSLLLRKEYKGGLILSMINQLFQTVAIAFGGYKFDFFSGTRLAGGFNFTDKFVMKLDFRLTSEFGFSWKSGQEYYMYINLVAFFLIYIILDIYEEIFKKDKTIVKDDMIQVSETIIEEN